MKLHRLFATIALASMLLAACAPAATPAAAPTSAPAATAAPAATEAPKPTAAVSSGKTGLDLWTHSAGNPNELAVIQTWVDKFNSGSDKYQVTIQSFPQAS